MKYKVGDKVKARRKYSFDKGEILKITKVDNKDHMYFCEGANAHCWQPERDLEPLDQSLTFQQKLDRFKREPIGFLVKSKEIADELAKVFEREGMNVSDGSNIRKFMLNAVEISKYYAGNAYVSYCAAPYKGSLSYGTSDFEGESDKHRELLDITLEELKSYNANTLEDKLALFKAGTHVLHTPTQEIYDKLMVELEKRGYVWESGDKPTCFDGFIDRNTCIFRGTQSIMKVIDVAPEDFSTLQVITITSDGYHRVTAESNGVLAEALCNPTDKFSIHKGSHMALKRLLEKLEEDTEGTLEGTRAETIVADELAEDPEGFHVWDIVEVVECKYTFADKIEGIQGIVTDVGNDWCRVRFPIEFTGSSSWSFENMGLKLVRKYNA